MVQGRLAIIHHLDVMAAGRQFPRQRRHRGLGAAQRAFLGGAAVEFDAVVGKDDAGHSLFFLQLRLQV